MRFTTREDIELPAADVFAAVSDFETFERAAMRRGAEVERTGQRDAEGPGRGWDVKFRYRGKQRRLLAELARFEPQTRLETQGRAGGLTGVLRVEVLPLSPRRTRLVVDLDIKPTTLSARLLLQSLRLAKSRLTARYKGGVARFGRALEARHSKPSLDG